MRLYYFFTAAMRLMMGAVLMAGALGVITAAGDAIDDSNEPASIESRNSIRGSDLPIPRFVSLKSNTVNMRVGPGTNYPVKWQYHRQGLPLKVIGEFEVWRQVEDHTGEQGWMHVSTLDGDRNALVLGGIAPIRRRGEASSPIIAVAEGGVILALEGCEGGWCKVAHSAAQGWIERSGLWGVLGDPLAGSDPLAEGDPDAGGDPLN